MFLMLLVLFMVLIFFILLMSFVFRELGFFTILDFTVFGLVRSLTMASCANAEWAWNW